MNILEMIEDDVYYEIVDLTQNREKDIFSKNVNERLNKSDINCLNLDKMIIKLLKLLGYETVGAIINNMDTILNLNKSIYVIIKNAITTKRSVIKENIFNEVLHSVSIDCLDLKKGIKRQLKCMSIDNLYTIKCLSKQDFKNCSFSKRTKNQILLSFYRMEKQIINKIESGEYDLQENKKFKIVPLNYKAKHI